MSAVLVMLYVIVGLLSGLWMTALYVIYRGERDRVSSNDVMAIVSVVRQQGDEIAELKKLHTPPKKAVATKKQAPAKKDAKPAGNAKKRAPTK